MKIILCDSLLLLKVYQVEAISSLTYLRTSKRSKLFSLDDTKITVINVEV